LSQTGITSGTIFHENPIMLSAAHCLDCLVTMTHPDGGWGYAPGRAPQVEPTCLALLALSLDRPRYAPAVEQGLACLRQWQAADGAYRVRHGREEAVWPTALALFAHAALEEDPAAQERAAAWLLGVRGEDLEDPAQCRETFDIDPDLVGWPWSAGTFSWTEPTAWACVALRRAGWGDHPRVAEGLRLLLDRAFDDGGINSGNRRVFGRLTDPVPAATALFLLACGGREDQPRVQAARSYLLREMESDQDLENLCWTRLALARWPDDAAAAAALPALQERILTAYQRRKEAALFAHSPVREALTALAVAAPEQQPFQLPAADAHRAPPVAVPPPRQRLPWTARFGTTVRGWGVKALGQLRSTPAQTAVHIAPAADYQADLAAVVRDQYEHFRSQVPLQGKRVVLKPNLVEYHHDKVINTNPRVVAAVIELCRREGAAEVIVAEGPGHWRNTEYLVTASGLGDVLRHYQVPFVDLNHDDPAKVPNLGRLTGLEFLYFAKTIADAEVLISLPKLKTHHWAGVTLSLKNLFGTLPGICYGWPKNELHWRGIDNSIVDIALTRAPDLAVVDGVVAMEGDGPLNGTPVPMGVLVMGSDPLAVDATCCRLMQLDPEQVGHLQLGHQKKLGILQEGRIQQLGEPIARFSQPFETLPQFEVLHARSRQPQMV
jgi:uncharacterized protein (DUF362 family)